MHDKRLVSMLPTSKQTVINKYPTVQENYLILFTPIIVRVAERQ